MEENDKIIVFRKYDSSIEANLAKTKLDAHGIPCFLTEENLNNLYPLQNLLLFGVRLHIFSKDLPNAEQVLETALISEEPSVCPVCRSQNIALDHTKKLTPRIARLILAIFTFATVPVKKIYRCQDCAREFETL